LFSGSDDRVINAAIRSQPVWPSDWISSPFVQNEPVNPATRSAASVPGVGHLLSGGLLLQVWSAVTGPFRGLFDSRLTLTGAAYLLLCCFWAALVWAVFGGAITRIAAVGLTTDEAIGVFDALRHSLAKVGSYFLAPFFPLLGVLMTFVPLVVLGLIMRFDFGLLLGGLLWPLVLVAGLFMAILTVGLAAGWPLMWPTIGTEGTDAFDALSRSYAYVYQRPLAYLVYAVVASVLGFLGWLVVYLFSAAVLYLSTLGIAWGMGTDRSREFETLVSDPGTAEGVAWAGWGLILLWHECVWAIAAGFLFGFFWVAATAIYLLLRRHVDATEMDEVFIEEREPAYSVPPLAQDTGVAAAMDEAEE
jgi:hypothetical protein